WGFVVRDPTGWGIAMKSPFAMMALAGVALTAPLALAQMPKAPTQAQASRPAASMAGGGPRPVNSVPALSPAGPAPGAPGAGGNGARSPASGAPGDGPVFEAPTALPAPTTPDQPNAPAMALPMDPIEPFLLTRDNGPFMVMAKTFRGPDAERW